MSAQSTKEIRFSTKTGKLFLVISLLLVSSCLIHKEDFFSIIEEERVKDGSITVMYIYDPIISNQCEVGIINTENEIILPKIDFFKDSMYYTGIELQEYIDLLQEIHDKSYIDENILVGCNGCPFYIVVKYSNNNIDTLLKGYR